MSIADEFGLETEQDIGSMHLVDGWMKRKYEIMPSHKEPLAIDTWTERMLSFMRIHVKQFKEYDMQNHLLVLERFQRFANGSGLPSRTSQNLRHKNAIEELTKLFKCVALEALSLQIAYLVKAYAILGRTKDFEEIAFIFAIVVNEPNIRKYETCWE
jgi:hypothetical protein